MQDPTGEQSTNLIRIHNIFVLRWQEALELCRGYHRLSLERDIFAVFSALQLARPMTLCALRVTMDDSKTSCLRPALLP